MALAFGLDHIIISDDRPKDKSASKYLDNTAALRGKPTITVEAGYAGTVETDDVASLVQGTRSVMRLLKMLPGTPHAIDHPVWIKTLGEVTSPVDGIFYPLVKRDTFVEAGRKLGDVTDYFGKVIFEARAPVTGIILHICAVPSMKKGDNIANIGVIATKAP
jgi:predicted deacylase